MVQDPIHYNTNSFQSVDGDGDGDGDVDDNNDYYDDGNHTY